MINNTKETVLKEARLRSVNNPDIVIYAFIGECHSYITDNEETAKEYDRKGYILYCKFKDGYMIL